MDRARASEIERIVIYSKLNPMPEDIDSQSAFEIGMMIGKMHQALRDELNKETKSVDE